MDMAPLWKTSVYCCGKKVIYFMKFFVLIGIYVILNSFGQLFIKMGTLEMKEITTFYDLLNLKLMGGITLFGLSFLTWIYIVSKNNLSYAFPFALV